MAPCFSFTSLVSGRLSLAMNATFTLDNWVGKLLYILHNVLTTGQAIQEREGQMDVRVLLLLLMIKRWVIHLIMLCINVYMHGSDSDFHKFFCVLFEFSTCLSVHTHWYSQMFNLLSSKVLWYPKPVSHQDYSWTKKSLSVLCQVKFVLHWTSNQTPYFVKAFMYSCHHIHSIKRCMHTFWFSHWNILMKPFLCLLLGWKWDANNKKF